MNQMKKVVSLMLSAAMALSVMSPFAMSAYAAEPAADAAAVLTEATPETAIPAEVEEKSKQSEAVEKVAALYKALPKAADVAAMSDEEISVAADALTEAMNAYEELSEDDAAVFEETYTDLIKAAEEDLAEALSERMDNEVATTSLRPMREYRDLKLSLSGYSRDQYKAFSVDDLMSQITDADGNQFSIDLNGATTVWFLFGLYGYQREEIHTLNNGETVNLWRYGKSGDSTYEVEGYGGTQTMIMVVGRGDQMDDEHNVRSVIDEEIYTTQLVSNLSGNFMLRKESSSSYNTYVDATSTGKRTDDYCGMGMPGVEITYQAPTSDNGTYYLEWSHPGEEQLVRAGYTVKVYDAEAFKAGTVQEIQVTDNKIALSSDEQKMVVLISDSEGNIVGSYGITAKVLKTGKMNATIYNKNGDKYVTSSAYIGGSSYGYNFKVDYNATNIISGIGGHSICTSSVSAAQGQIPEAYAALKENSQIKAVYSGLYTSAEEAAASGKDVTAQVVVSNDASVPSGYKLDFTKPFEDVSFTIVMQDDTTQEIQFYYYESSSGSNNTNFSISSLRSATNDYIGFVTLDTVRDVPLDTYYGNKYSDISGYQLIMTNEELSESELEAMVPRFSTASGNKVYSNGEMISGQTSLANALWSDMDEDGKADTVEFTVATNEGSTQNYMVTFAAKQADASLYVAGPEERLVNLNAANDFQHDILIGNTGAKDLTITSVELKDAQNVAIDPYWTVKNDSVIPAMDALNNLYIVTDDDGNQQTYYNYYATVANVAKIRLITAGSGAVSGTLVVTAGNGEKREIKLTGTAAVPGFTTDAVSEGVKYVPYAFMVATDNMYAWNKTSFELVSGTLPKGVELNSTGELYGVPQESGTFNFTVKVTHSSEQFADYPNEQSFTLVINENSDANVYQASDKSYELKQALGAEQTSGEHDYYLEDASTDQLFVSYGDYYLKNVNSNYFITSGGKPVKSFQSLWLNGEELTEGVDYTAEQGSTVITIRSQTFANKANRNGANTIAMEFRDYYGELKRTAQNFYMDADTVIEPTTPDNGNNNNNGGNNNNTNNDSNANSNNADSNTANGTAGTSGSTQAGTSAAASSQATGSAAGNSAAQGSVNLTAQVLDANGQILSGVTVVLHSTPRSAVTDANGNVTFQNVEYGEHTFTVIRNGVTLGTSSFTVEKASKASAASNVVYAPDGGSVKFVAKLTAASTVQIGSGSAVASAAASSAAIPQTGDTFQPLFWVVLMMLSALGFGGTVVRRKKHSN